MSDMGKVAKSVRTLWRLVSNADTVWSLLGYIGWAKLIVALVFAGWLAVGAYLNNQPWWAVTLIAALGFLVLIWALNGIVYLAHNRRQPAQGPTEGDVHRELEIAAATIRQARGEIAVPLDTPKPRLTIVGRERADAALVAVLDYLGGDFYRMTEPIRDVLGWQAILNTQGTEILREKTEIARACAVKLRGALHVATHRYADELGTLGIEPMAIKTKSLALEEPLHSIGSIAYAMRPDEPNLAAFELSAKAYTAACNGVFEELDSVKRQITEARRKIARGEL